MSCWKGGEAYVDAINLEQRDNPVQVFNIEVEDFHPHFVGSNNGFAGYVMKEFVSVTVPVTSWAKVCAFLNDSSHLLTKVQGDVHIVSK